MRKVGKERILSTHEKIFYFKCMGPTPITYLFKR